ncbi:MAG: methylenetetrahydrofolate reductase [Actinomycetes bacterium]
MSRLRQLAESRSRPIVTAEFPSIDGGNLDTVKAKLDPILAFVDAINATDNPAAHAHASNSSIAIALKMLGAEPIMQVVCRDKNRLAAQADIVGAALFGVVNVCALTGDDVTAGDEPQARRVFDLDGPQLVKVMSGLAEGRYLSGRKISPAPELFVGAVENPFGPPQHYRVERAKLKSDAGARFMQLQIGYQPSVLESFIAGCVANGVAARTALLPTVVLTKTARALSFMHDNVPGISVPEPTRARIAGASDIPEESFQLTLELARHALSLDGVAGIHIADFRHDGSLARLVSELNLSVSEPTDPSAPSDPSEPNAPTAR